VNRILIVRMSALGDIVHALPVLAAIRDAWPDVEVDWLADRKYAGVLTYVDGISRCVVGRPSLSKAVATMRTREYDVAIDLQGLLKSAAMARLSGARRIVGFEQSVLRERAAAWFYTETAKVAPGVHIIHKNLSVMPVLGLDSPGRIRFPFSAPESAVANEISAIVRLRGLRGFALINPGAGWPNKQWRPDRFGAVARHLEQRHRLAPLVLWGSGEMSLANAVIRASGSAGVCAPETTLGDLLALAGRAALMVAGDTGPMHVAAAVGTPIVGLYGPTWPERNGPWHPDDVVVSRAAACECHHKRQCSRDSSSQMCLNDVTVDEVCEAVDRRLARAQQGPP
jgi:lipopolysaccharide heptosyltransferase I